MEGKAPGPVSPALEWPARLVTTAELAELLGVDQRTLRRWRKEERIRAVVIGRTVRFRLSDVLPP